MWRLVDTGWIALGPVREPGAPGPVSCAGALALAHRTLRRSDTRPTYGHGQRHWQEALLSALVAHFAL